MPSGNRKLIPTWVRRYILLAINNLGWPASGIGQDEIATCDIEPLAFAEKDAEVIDGVEYQRSPETVTILRRIAGALRQRWESRKLGETGEGVSRLFFVFEEEVSRHIVVLFTVKAEVHNGIEYHPPGEIKGDYCARRTVLQSGGCSCNTVKQVGCRQICGSQELCIFIGYQRVRDRGSG